MRDTVPGTVSLALPLLALAVVPMSSRGIKVRRRPKVSIPAAKAIEPFEITDEEVNRLDIDAVGFLWAGVRLDLVKLPADSLAALEKRVFDEFNPELQKVRSRREFRASHPALAGVVENEEGVDKHLLLDEVCAQYEAGVMPPEMPVLAEQIPQVVAAAVEDSLARAKQVVTPFKSGNNLMRTGEVVTGTLVTAGALVTFAAVAGQESQQAVNEVAQVLNLSPNMLLTITAAVLIVKSSELAFKAYRHIKDARKIDEEAAAAFRSNGFKDAAENLATGNRQRAIATRALFLSLEGKQVPRSPLR